MRYCIFLFFLWFTIGIGAQEPFSHAPADLGTVLAALEKEFDLKFSYNPATVDGRELSSVISESSLSAILLQIEKDLDLSFEKVDERYYLIRRNNKVCGYIKDALDNMALEGVTIINTDHSSGTVSNTLGYFEIKNINRSDTLSISFLGYGTVKISRKQFSNDSCKTILLSEQNYQLNEVVVQEYLASGIVKTNDGSVRMRPGNLAILGGLSEPDILQNIQLLPGIESPSETASGLYIRGGSPDQNLILWDGIKMYNSDHFFGMISAFNPYITKDVKVSRGGTRAEYGDRVSGVIDITTYDDIPNRIEGGIGLNMTHTDAYLKIPVSENLGLLISGRRSLNEIFQTPTFNSFSKRVFQNTSIRENQEFFEPEYSNNKEQFYFTDFTIKAIVELSTKNRLIFSNLYTKNRLDYSFEDEEQDVASSDKLNIRNLGMNVNWETSWTEKFSSRAQLYYSNYDLDYSGTNRFDSFSRTLSKTNNIREVGGSFHTDYKIGANSTFSNGYQFFTTKAIYRIIEDDYTLEDSGENPTHTLYSQINYRKPEKWYLDLGLRASYYQGLSKMKVEPRLYAERKFGDYFSLKGFAELKNQAISQLIEFETQDFGLENQIWALSSDDDPPLLRSEQFSLGFLYEKKGWLIDMDTYYKKIRGLTSITKGFLSPEDNLDIGISTTGGIDLLVRKKIKAYTTWVGYTFSKTYFKFSALNQGERFRGNNDITHSLTWSNSYRWNRFQFSLGWKLRSGIPYTEATGFTTEGEETFINYNRINSETLPVYHRMDFSALYNFEVSKKENAAKAKFGFSLLNLYNRENQLSETFALFETTDDNGTDQIELGQINQFSLGITPNIFFRLNF